MDAASVASLLASIKTATDIAKLIKEGGESLEKAEAKLKLAELISALADAKLEVVGVQQALADAEGQVRELQVKLQVKGSLRWREPAYWLGDGASSDGPYCQKCYDTESKLVRLLHDGDGRFECKGCNNIFVTREFRARQEAAVRSYNSSLDSGF